MYIYIYYMISDTVCVCVRYACVHTYVYACVRTCMRARTHERGNVHLFYDYVLYAIHIIVVLIYTVILCILVCCLSHNEVVLAITYCFVMAKTLWLRQYFYKLTSGMHTSLEVCFSDIPCWYVNNST